MYVSIPNVYCILIIFFDLILSQFSNFINNLLIIDARFNNEELMNTILFIINLLTNNILLVNKYFNFYYS